MKLPAYIRTAVCGAAIGLLPGSPAGAVVLAPNTSASLSGTTFQANPVLGGTVIRDNLLPFDVRGDDGGILLSGVVQDRVVRSSRTGVLIFAPRIRDLAGSSDVYIQSITVDGFENTVADVEYRVDGLGTVGPQTANRDASGDVIRFSFADQALTTSTSARFISALTDADELHSEGTIEIVMVDVATNRTYTTVISDAASPGEPPVVSPEEPPVVSPEEPVTDMVVSLITPGELTPGDLLSDEILIVVTNAGASAVPGSRTDQEAGYTVALSLATDEHGSQATVPSGAAAIANGLRSNTPDLPANATRKFRATGRLRPATAAGRYFLCATINPHAEIADTNVGNNTVCERVAVGSPEPEVVSPYVIRMPDSTLKPDAGFEFDAIRENVYPESSERVHVLLQFDEVPQAGVLDALGGELLNYVDGTAWIAALPMENLEKVADVAGARWAGPMRAKYKMGRYVQQMTDDDLAFAEDGRIGVTIDLHEDGNHDEAIAVIRSLGGDVIETTDYPLTVTAVLEPQAIKELARFDIVQYVERLDLPLDENNDSNRDITGVDNVLNSALGLTGQGVRAMVYDSGVIDRHPDFGNRIVDLDPNSNVVRTHATHVAGTLGGDGRASDGEDSDGVRNEGADSQWSGMAPRVSLLSYAVQGISDTLYDDAGDLEDDVANANPDLVNMSLGNNVVRNGFDCRQLGDYTHTARVVDGIVTGNRERSMPFFEAAGNERRDPATARRFCSNTGFYTIGSPATNKNAIIVGATNSNDQSMTSFSSFGPTDDGRTKPDVVAPGCQSNDDRAVTSTVPGGGYGGMCGTSMASPTAAGIGALLLEHWRLELDGQRDPRSDTLKAVLLHTADDLGNPGPDFSFGWGHVNTETAVELISAHAQTPLIRVDRVTQGSAQKYEFNMAAGRRIRTTLVWNDPPGSRLAPVALVNDLNLELVSPGGEVFRPYLLNPADPQRSATTGVDTLNNVEMIDATASESGVWTVVVRGSAVRRGPQSFSLIVPAEVTPTIPEAPVEQIAIGRNDGDNMRFAIYGDVATGTTQISPTFGNRWGSSRSVSAMVMAQLDADPELELVVGRDQGDNMRWAVYDDASQNFRFIQAFGGRWGSSRRTSALAAGDVDGDGRDEIVVGRNGGGGMRWIIYNDLLDGIAPMVASQGTGWGRSRGVTALATGDLDGNGVDEIIVGRSRGDNMRWQAHRYDSGEVVAFSVSQGNGWGDSVAVSALATGDIDNDGVDEVIVGRRARGNLRWGAYKWSGSGRFALVGGGQGGGWGSSRYPTRIATGDIDGDGVTDVVVGRNPGGNGRWMGYALVGNAFQRLGPEMGRGWGSSRGVGGLDMGDVDGDGREEIVVGRTAGNNVRWLIYRFDGTRYVQIDRSFGQGWGSSRGVNAIAVGKMRR